MRSTILPVAAVALSLPLCAQNSLLFCGRFPFVSLDAPNERVGGSITALDEFDFTFVTPGLGAVARTLQPSTAHQAYFGDGDNDGNYTKLSGFKTYFENIQIAGLFVQAADKTNVRPDDVYFTVRDNVATKQLEVFTTNGTAVHVLEPGDFVRFRSNGNAEFFMTKALFAKAAGLPPAGQSSVDGASALCQDTAGNLYYSPPTGGHWVAGNLQPTGPIFANDGSIVMIDAANITYDAATGNVLDVVQDSARLLFEEVGGGPSFNPLSVRTMVSNANGVDRTGGTIVVTGIFGKICGLDLDPSGGTLPASYPDPLGNFTQVPNFVFASDAGSYAGTIFSTVNSGSLAVINGVTCGESLIGVPATGAWLGVQFDLANFQPSLMGLQVVSALSYDPVTLDMPANGALPNAGLQATFDIDVHGPASTVALLVASLGPAAPGGFLASVPTSLLPVGGNSWPDLFTFPTVTALGFIITDPNGYGVFSFPNPHSGRFVGATLVLQAGAVNGATFEVSNPVLCQLK